MKTKGQALIESCFVLPLLIFVFQGIIICCYTLITHYLVDHWTYQATLCLATERSKNSCYKDLKNKLSMIPLAKFDIPIFFRTTGSSRVFVHSTQPVFLNIKIKESLKLPLTSKDFKGL